ncbi:MAG: hypothetical protein IKG04_05650, partial [Exiguobacterium sp.]|nr:hypothetical protein [Exiguobacterium sp.]
DHVNDTITVQLYKARFAQGSYPTVSSDATTKLVMPYEYVAVGDPVTISADDNWTHTWIKLPLSETIDGTTYSLTYYAKETSTTAEGVTASYAYEFNTSGANNTGIKTANITNIEDGSTSVVVNKNWTDGNANHSNDTVTFDLYRVATVPGALVVTVPNVRVNYGWITVKINDGTNDSWQTLYADNGWTFSNENLEDDKTYTVSVDSFDENVFKSVTIAGNDFVAGSEGGQVNLATTLKTSLTISVPSKPNKASKITVTVSDGTTSTDYDLESPDWSTTISNLDHSKTYYVSVKSFDESDFLIATIDGTDSVSGATGGEIQVNATIKSSGGSSVEAPGAGTFVARIVNADNVSASWYYITMWGDAQNVMLNSGSMSNSTTLDPSKDTYTFGFARDCFNSLYVRSSSRLIYPTSDTVDLIQSNIYQIQVEGSSDGIALEFSSVPFDTLTTQNAKFTAPRLSAKSLRGQADAKDLEPVLHNLQLPDSAVKLDSKTVTIGGADAWTHTWDGLPTSETVNGVTYNYTYLVKETTANTSADSVDATYSYVYNTAGKASSGVRAVTVANKPTYSGGLKIRKAFEGLPEGTNTSNLAFRITAPDGTSQDVSYGQFTNGEYTVADTGLPVDDVYTVTELNAESLIDGYTLVTSKSITSASGSVPAEDVGVIELTNTYAPIKGTISVTKNVTLNGTQEYDDVAAGQRFKVGLERKNGNAWEVVTDPADSTKPLVQTITIGVGSTGTATFNNLDLGTYRAYELADDGITRVTAQDESTGTAIG